MNDSLDPLFEERLRTLRPSDPPSGLLERLHEPPMPSVASQFQVASGSSVRWRSTIHRLIVRWMLPTAAVAALLFFLVRLVSPGPSGPSDVSAHPEADWKPDEIEVDRQLLAAFEYVAQIPGGMPVRFRCYDWQEDMVARDAQGVLEVQCQGPRLEIVPVSLEIY